MHHTECATTGAVTFALSSRPEERIAKHPAAILVGKTIAGAHLAHPCHFERPKGGIFIPRRTRGGLHRRPLHHAIL